MLKTKTPIQDALHIYFKNGKRRRRRERGLEKQNRKKSPPQDKIRKDDPPKAPVMAVVSALDLVPLVITGEDKPRGNKDGGDGADALSILKVGRDIGVGEVDDDGDPLEA